MLALPTPYTDESVYSVCARYGDRMRLPTVGASAELLFGRKHTRLDFALPRNLNALSDRDPNVDAERWIEEHTCLPFYAPFLPADRLQTALRLILEGGTATLRLFNKPASDAVAVPRRLRFCPQCLAEQQRDVGDMYWSRLHQLPGILLCPVHLVWLEETDVRERQVGFVSAESWFEHHQVPVCRVAHSERDALEIALARSALQLFRDSYRCDDLKSRYLSRLAEQGFATPAHTLRPELAKAFAERFSAETLFHYGWRLDPTRSRNQLTQLILTKTAKHPVHHLMLLRFLNEDVDRFFNRDADFAPFGEAPWPCLNMHCPHYRQSVIEQIALGFTRRSSRRPLGTFICPTCRFCYSRAGADEQPSDRFRVGIVRSYGLLWDAKLRAAWDTHNGNIAAVCKTMQVGRDAVVANARRLGLLPAGGTGKPRESAYGVLPTEDNIQRYREQWLVILEKHSDESTTTIAEKHPSVYGWLDRHDYVWLKQHTPESRQGKNARNGKASQDAELAERVKQAITELQFNEPPVRLSRNSIARNVGLTRSFKLTDLDRMPVTASLVAKAVETHEQFAIRRVRYWATLLAVKSKPFTRSDLIKAAGVSKTMQTSFVLQTIDALVQERSPP